MCNLHRIVLGDELFHLSILREKSVCEKEGEKKGGVKLDVLMLP